jgi:hypothetical protein
MSTFRMAAFWHRQARCGSSRPAAAWAIAVRSFQRMPPVSYVPLILLDGLLCLLTVASMLLGVFAVITGRRPLTNVLWPDTSPELARLDGMALTLSGMGGLLLALQIAGITLFMANGWPMPHTPVGAVVALAIIVALFLLELTLIIASAAVSFTARSIRQGRSPLAR